MFLFSCCRGVNCGCQNDPDAAEVSRSSHSSSYDTYPRHSVSEKHIQRRLLPQPVATKQFIDYSGCSHTSTSRSLLVGSTQTVDYEEVLFVSVSSGSRQTEEQHYADISDSVISKPPCSIGVDNDNFSLDTLSRNGNLLQCEVTDDVKLLADAVTENGNVDDSGSASSSACSSVDDSNGAEVKYIADIKQFQFQLSSATQPQSAALITTEGTDQSVQHSTDLKCPCKSCTNFRSQMHSVVTKPGLGTTVVSDAFCNQYGLMPDSGPDDSEVFGSENNEFTRGAVSMPPAHSDSESGAFDDDRASFSTSDELHYVFHKFINIDRSDNSFSGIPAGNQLWPREALNKVEQEFPSGSATELTRSADDLEVAFFMDSNISPASPADNIQTSLTSEGLTVTLTSASLAAVVSDTEPLVSHTAYEHLLAVGNISEADSVNDGAVLKDVVETVITPVAESENVCDVVNTEPGSLSDNLQADSDLIVLDDDSPHTYAELHHTSCELRRDVIIQDVFDTSSFFIELPAVADEQISDAEVADMPAKNGTAVTQELAPTEDSAIVQQSLEVVSSECVIEHPVSVDSVKPPSQADVSYGDGDVCLLSAFSVSSFVNDVVEFAVQKVADDAIGSFVGVCRVLSEDESTSSEWSKQILITNAPSPYGDLNQPFSEERSDFDQLQGSETAGAMDLKCCVDDSVGVSVLGANVDISTEAAFTTDEKPLENPQLESYVISYDVQQSQQSLDEDGVNMMLQTTAGGKNGDDVKPSDLVQPLEHVKSDIMEPALETDDSCSAGDVILSTDIVEDFFMQYVLPVASLSHGMKTPTSDDHTDCAADQAAVDQKDDAGQLECAADSVVQAAINEALNETDVNVSAATASIAVLDPYFDDAANKDDEIRRLESAAESLLDVVVSDVVAAGSSAAATTSGDLLSRLLHSPSEHRRKKSVHFADMHGLELETIQHYEQSPPQDQHPSSLDEFLSKLSSVAAERRARWTEHHPSRLGSWFCNSSVYLMACFELPSTQSELLDRVAKGRVALESCCFDDAALAISGVVRVANIAFRKELLVRYSVNRWSTQTDVSGEYIARSNDGPTDRFSFTIILPSRKQFSAGSEVEFAICFMAGDGPSSEFWDNNYGRNYVVRCCSKATSADDRHGISSDIEHDGRQ